MALLTNLTAYYKFDEASGNAADSVGTNTLTNNNTVTYGAGGVINNSALFTAASSQTLSKSTPTSVPGSDNTGGDMSVNGWVKITSQPGANDRRYFLALWNGTTNNRSWSVNYVNLAGTVSLEITVSSNGTAGTAKQINQTLTNATLYMVTWVYTASTGGIEIFVNGSSIGTATGLPTSTFNTAGGATLKFGNIDDVGNYLDARLDEFGIWSRTLTGAEITSLYNSGAGLAYPFGGNSGFFNLL